MAVYCNPPNQWCCSQQTATVQHLQQFGTKVMSQDWLQPNEQKHPSSKKKCYGYAMAMTMNIWGFCFMLYLWLYSITKLDASALWARKSNVLISIVRGRNKSTVARLCSSQFKSNDQTCVWDNSAQHPSPEGSLLQMMSLWFIVSYFVLILSTVLTTGINPLPSIDHSLTVDLVNDHVEVGIWELHGTSVHLFVGQASWTQISEFRQ